MTGLAALFAKQKAKESAATPHSGITNPTNPATPIGKPNHSDLTNSTTKPNPDSQTKNPEPINSESDAELKEAAVKAANEARLAEEKADAPVKQAAAKPTLANVFAKTASAKPTAPAQPESKPEAKPAAKANPFARSTPAPAASTDSAVAKPASPTKALTALDKLAAVDLADFGSDSESEGSNSGDAEVAYFSRFADEEPATKPERDLPSEMTDNEKAFVVQLDSMYEVIHDPDMMSTCLRTFMIELQDNPEYTRLVAPEDVRTLILGARATMGLAKVKKQEAKAKRASGGTSKSRKKAVDLGIGDLSDLLAGFGGDD